MRYTVKPKFIIRDPSTDSKVCAKCRFHRILAIARRSDTQWVYMFSDLSSPPGDLTFIHRWGLVNTKSEGSASAKMYDKVPECLQFYKEVGYVEGK